MKKDSILIVDDEPNNFEVIETLLADENYDIYYASSGRDALASMEAFDPDVILLDLEMPEMNGLELCQRLKITRKWKAVPIIMVTAATGQEILAKCLAAGADDFLNKPVARLELKARIASMLRIKKQFDRIESLTLLQQKNITSLESGMGELGCDLAVGLANELHEPLTKIVDRLSTLERDIGTIERRKIIRLVKSAKRAALQLEKSTNKVWIYLELALEKKQFNDYDNCNIKTIAKQVATVKSQFFNREEDIAIDVENARLAATEYHCELVIKELIDYTFARSKNTKIKIYGRAKDNIFHLWAIPSDPNWCEDELLDPDRYHNSEERELGLSLKIVKKIVNIYDGSLAILDLRSGDSSSQISAIHITLPLAPQGGSQARN